MFSIRQKFTLDDFLLGKSKRWNSNRNELYHKVIMNFNVFDADRINLHLIFTHVKINIWKIYIRTHLYIFILKCVVFLFRKRWDETDWDFLFKGFVTFDWEIRLVFKSVSVMCENVTLFYLICIVGCDGIWCENMHGKFLRQRIFLKMSCSI